MAICFSTALSLLDEDKVIDSQFYDPKKLSILDSLKKINYTFIKNEFDEITELSTDKEKIIFPAVLYDLPDSLGNLFTDGKSIDSFSDLGSTKKIGLKGDFVISRLRHYLKEFGLLPDHFNNFLLSTEYVVLRKKHNIPAEILLPFLLLEQIQYVFEKSQRGSNHPRLANKDILNLPIPNVLLDYKETIQNLVYKAISDFNLSKKLYPEAEQELLERMSWDQINITHVLDYQIKRKDILENERIDPEFYQPKFEKLIEHLQKIGSRKLSNFCPIVKRGVSPSYDENGEVFIVNSQNLGATGLIDIYSLEKCNVGFYNEDKNKDAHLVQFDVLTYATGAYIGRTNSWLGNDSAIAGIDCIISEPENMICNPVYLSLFLNSPAGLMQSKQRASGSAQRHLYPKDIKQYQVFIPEKNGKPDLEWQKKLANKIIQAHEINKQAKLKLQKAKELVEKEIKKLIL